MCHVFVLKKECFCSEKCYIHDVRRGVYKRIMLTCNPLVIRGLYRQASILVPGTLTSDK